MLKKEKNYLYISTPESEDKVYTLNINTGEFIGLRGKPIKSIPTAIQDNMRNNHIGLCYLDLRQGHVGGVSKKLQIVDSWLNCGIKLFLNVTEDYKIADEMMHSKEWKDILNYLKSNDINHLTSLSF